MLAAIYPSGLSWWLWTIILLVAYLLNVFVVTRLLFQVGKPDSTPDIRKKQPLTMSMYLSWPLLYMILIVITEMGNTAGVGLLIGSIVAWIVFIAVEFMIHSKTFEGYHELRKKLGGSDAYANLHNHMWAHIYSLIGAALSFLGMLPWMLTH